MAPSPMRRGSQAALLGALSRGAATCGTQTPTALDISAQQTGPPTTQPLTVPPQVVTPIATATPRPTEISEPVSTATSAPVPATVTPVPPPPILTVAPTAVATSTSAPTPTVTPAPAPTPTVAPAAVVDGRECLNHDGVDRCWSVQTSGANEPRPLVVDLHGWGGSGEQQRGNSKLDLIAAEEHFVAVWPDGLNSSWNAGSECCGRASSAGVDDVGFLRSVVASVGATHNVDLDRVYVTGFSNGCAMAQRLAAEASDLVTAVACTSLFRLVPVAGNYSPVPILAVHGSRDSVISYEPGDFEGAPLGGAIDNVEAWALLNGCSFEPTEVRLDEDKVQRSYPGCASGSEVMLVTIDDADHNLYIFAEPRTETTRLMWDFLRQFPR